MSHDEFLKRILEMWPHEFERLVFDVVRTSERFTEVAFDGIVDGVEIDIRATERGHGFFPTVWLFEVKSRPLTSSDVVHAVAAKLNRVQKAISGHTGSEQLLHKFVLVVSGAFTKSARDAALEVGIELWDGATLADLCSAAAATLTFGEPIEVKRSSRTSKPKWQTLSDSLIAIPPGQEEFGAYQSIVSDIFQYLFCPPLEKPRFEFYDEAKRNRRDAIFENSAQDGFWAGLRATYSAHYVVVDAKNHGGEIGKDEVLRIAHYLKPYGCGLFGVLVCRETPSDACRHAIKEQWIGSQKMIVVLANEDLIEMLEMKGTAGRPEERIRVAIADFRMRL